MKFDHSNRPADPGTLMAAVIIICVVLAITGLIAYLHFHGVK